MLFQLFLLRKQASRKIPEYGRFYICSLSTETIVYKVRLVLETEMSLTILKPCTHQTSALALALMLLNQSRTIFILEAGVDADGRCEWRN